MAGGWLCMFANSSCVLALWGLRFASLGSECWCITGFKMYLPSNLFEIALRKRPCTVQCKYLHLKAIDTWKRVRSSAAAHKEMLRSTIRYWKVYHPQFLLKVSFLSFPPFCLCCCWNNFSLSYQTFPFHSSRNRVKLEEHPPTRSSPSSPHEYGSQ